MVAVPIRNALTIDVEDYFQVSALAPYISRDSWDIRPCRIERNIDDILGMLNERRARATFFTLGWIAERYPSLVRRVIAEGHELASHGYAHLRATEQNPKSFFDDVSRSKFILEDVGGVIVNGYRAPSFSIGKTNLWALESLNRAGYTYSSSIYPIQHDHYGMPDAPRFAFRPSLGSDLLELPITTVNLFNRNFPAGGGGYFRLLPYWMSHWCLKRVNQREGRPCIFYFHPWEIDPGQPRQQGLTLKTRFRHYVNLSGMRQRIRLLLEDFEWDRVDRIFFNESI